MKNIFTILATMACSFLAATAAAQIQDSNEVWISPVLIGTNADGQGIGTAGDPYIAASATTFDSLMGGLNGPDGTAYTSPIPTNSTIHLMAGIFKTYGVIYPKTDWKIRGAGIDVTFVQQQPWNPALQGSKVGVFGIADGLTYGSWNQGVNDGIEISDLTIDCNLQANTNGGCFEAVYLPAGNNQRISRVKAINWGTTGSGFDNNECFIFSIQGRVGSIPTIFTNVVIDDCIIGPAAPISLVNGADGFGIGGSGDDSYLSAGWIADAEIRNCSVSGIKTGGGVGQPFYFNAITASDVYGLRIVGNRIVNVDGNGFYSSCGSIYNCTIANNSFLDIGNEVGIAFANSDACGGNSDYLKNNIFIYNNVLTTASNGTAMFLDGYDTNSITDLVVEGNYIDTSNPLSSAKPGINFGNAPQVICEHNYFNEGTNSTTDRGVGDPGPFYASSTSFVNDDDNLTQLGQNVVPGGDQTIVFYPTNGAGWYRLTDLGADSGWASGDVRIVRDFGIDNTLTDAEFDFSVIGYTIDSSAVGTINMVRSLEYGAGSVEAARIGCTGAGAALVYLDIYVATVPGNVPIVIKTRGGEGSNTGLPDMGPRWLPLPQYEGTTNMPPASKTLWFSRGLSTSDFFTAGTNGVRLNDDSGLILDTALNIVDPAHGGLGIDASTWSAGLLPYTSGVGVFGSTPISSFGASLIDGLNNSTVLTTLGLPDNPGTIVTNDANGNVSVTGTNYAVQFVGGGSGLTNLSFYSAEHDASDIMNSSGNLNNYAYPTGFGFDLTSIRANPGAWDASMFQTPRIVNAILANSSLTNFSTTWQLYLTNSVPFSTNWISVTVQTNNPIGWYTAVSQVPQIISVPENVPCYIYATNTFSVPYGILTNSASMLIGVFNDNSWSEFVTDVTLQNY